jgi:hypothetical protein
LTDEFFEVSNRPQIPENINSIQMRDFLQLACLYDANSELAMDMFKMARILEIKYILINK